MARRRLWMGLAAIGAVAVVGWLSVNALLADAFTQGPTEGPFDADGVCPVFVATYPRCEVRFGNSGLSTLNSLYETFVGEGAFRIDAFEVETPGAGRFNVTALSNRGPIRSEIHTDRLVRLGQERENEVINRTHQSAFCDRGRIYEHQVGYARGRVYTQDLELWTEQDALRFRLFQNGAPTADVVCHAR
jgi:hypothetical protein